MATQTIRVAVSLPSATYTVFVQEDGSSANMYTSVPLEQDDSPLFWLFDVDAATNGIYSYQIYNEASEIVAYGWFYSAEDVAVTIPDCNSRDEAIIRQRLDVAVSTRLDEAGVRDALGMENANLDGQLGTIAGVTNKMDTMLQFNGTAFEFTPEALTNIPSGTVVVHPGYASWAEKIAGQALTLFHNEAGTVGPIRVQNRTGTSAIAADVDLSALTGLYFLVVAYDLSEVYRTSSVTISGTENSQFTVPVTTDLTGTCTNETDEEWHYWSLRDENDSVISTGRLRVRQA